VLTGGDDDATSGTQADDGVKYPDWKGAWIRLDDVSGGSYDPSKRPGRGQHSADGGVSGCLGGKPG